MKAALTLTYILFPVTVGLIIAGIAVDNGYIIGWGIALFLLDFFIGTLLKHKEEEEATETWNSLPHEEKRTAVRGALEGRVEEARNAGVDVDRLFAEYIKSVAASSDEDDEKSIDRRSMFETLEEREERLSKEFNDICLELRIEGNGETAEEGTLLCDTKAGCFLLSLCAMMEHAPPQASFGTFDGLCTVSAGKNTFLFYCFKCFGLNQNVYIILVLTKWDKLRFFTIETSACRTGPCIMLCEYTGGAHVNFGETDPADIFKRVLRIVENSDTDRSVFNRGQ